MLRERGLSDQFLLFTM